MREGKAMNKRSCGVSHLIRYLILFLFAVLSMQTTFPKIASGWGEPPLTVNVSPAGSGNITSLDWTANPTTYPATYTCSRSYTITAVPNSAAGYKFDRWDGEYTGSANPLTVDVTHGGKSVTAYFVNHIQAKTLDQTMDLLNSNKDVIVLCAKNYPWNSTAKIDF